MKPVLFFILISASLLLGQAKSADSDPIAGKKDNLRISDLVQQQIDRAKEKQSVTPVPVQKAVVKAELNLPVKPETTNFISSIPLQIKIFAVISVIILIALFFRRTILVFKKRSSQVLKNKITMLREEKVVARSRKSNIKLEEARKKLRESKSVFDTSEKQISRVAKGLNIAKGELILASRIKMFEIGKM